MHEHVPSLSFALALVAGLLIVSFGAEEAEAQRFQKKWLNIGEYQSYYSEGGIEPRRNPREGEQWPASDPNMHHFVRKALWVRVANWTDTDGETWNNKISHVGPRVQGENEVWPMEFELRAKYGEPEVSVDGLQSFHKPVFNQSIDRIVPNMKADRMIYNRLNALHGIQIERKVHAFSNQFHDQYHIWEYTFTNTGNVDGDEEIEKPDQTLEGVLFHFRHKYTINLAAGDYLAGAVTWGRNTISDFVGDGMQDYETDLRAFYSWHGRIPSIEQYNNLGGPVWSDNSGVIAEGDSVGRLGASEFIGNVTLHADVSGSDHSDDPEQPRHTFTFDSGLLNTNSAFNENVMQEELDFMTPGHQYPHHADQVVPDSPEYDTWVERFAEQQENAFQGINAGIMPAVTYGPYTMEPGDSIKIVFAEAVAGLRTGPAWYIGRKYKESGADDSQIISYDADGSGTIESDEQLTKNQWVMTGRDSLFKVYQRAVANWESGLEVPEAPMPPETFTVNSGVNQINLEWTTFSGASPQGWEIYRTRNRFPGAVEDSMQYNKIAELDAGARSYQDSDVTRGLQYYYYIQAVGPVNNDPTGNTPTGVRLKSNRYYTQTYNPASLKREPGDALSDAHIVPNPYNITSEQNVRWPSKRDRLGFLDIPGQSTIKIYTERGDLVTTIEHTDGSGDEFWDLKTEAEQTVVSGVYIAVITDNETGQQAIRKFIVVR